MSELNYVKKHAADRLSPEARAASDAYCRDYMAYLDEAKTEREAVTAAIRLAEEADFRPWVPGGDYKPGERVYYNNRGKALLLAVVGKEPLSKGANIAAAHIDSPRLDLKAVPLYEDSELALLKTHYYGGIRKYQWVTIPLELHGVVSLMDGSNLEIALGADPEDPVLYITDLLPHLAADQNKKTLADGITGESLNLLIGSVPVAGEGKERVKQAVLALLHEKYGITEEDFLSAELEAVPALNTRDVGLDRSMIGGYGHDDRVCAYAELMAILTCGTPDRTAVCILADKEEIGSEGVTGMQSAAFDRFVGDLCRAQGVSLPDCFAASFCLSADVANAFDPTYPEVSDRRNNAKFNYGVAICKFTGSRGKSGSNDASAEVMGKVRRMFAEKNVIWQSSELGKVDQGGGGTVAKFMALRNIDTVDAGVPVLAMHSPWELVAKFDCYETYLAMKALYELG